MKGTIMVIADGAAFGPQMEKIYQLVQRRTDICLYLPESFEWIILASDILDDSEVRAVLRHPSDFIESREYFSWERFFTSLLVMKSSDTWLKYAKSKLNPVYLKGKYREEILSVLPPTLQNELREGK